MRTQLVLVFAMFVIVPLGLRIAARPSTGPTTKLLVPLAKAAPIAALPAAVSFTLDQGAAAALLVLPWLGFTVALGIIGVGRLLSRRSLGPGIGVDAALVFIVVGSAWLLISRAGLRPLGFSADIVQLTAVHFHFAGFALPIITALVADRLGKGAALSIAVILGVPITAIGITVDGTTEWIAATFMACVGLVVAFHTLRLANEEIGGARTLLRIAGVSLFAGMCLAIGWAWSQQFGWTYLDIPGMVATHGMLNGFGFALMGLVAFQLLPDNPAGRSTEICVHLGRPSRERLAELRITSFADETTNPIGILNGETPEGMHYRVWRKTFDHVDFERAKAGMDNWAGHKRAGIARVPEVPAIRIGETLAMAIPVGPISVSATARVVEVFDELDRYGFSYSTLPHHPEDGEESFILHRHADGTLEMVVTAMWRGAAMANHVLPPLTRFLQNRAINRYLDGTAEWGSRTASREMALGLG